jgi:hypothetical protein
MILSREERAVALTSVLEMVCKTDFDITNIQVDSPAREVPSDRINPRKFKDTGVRIITITGNVPIDWQPSYGPETSDNADDLPGLPDEDTS